MVFDFCEVGQRVTDGFDDVPDDEKDTRLPRVFIAGDACHTHSAKAGQGMNVSMPDANNLAWKLISVLKRQARPELLKTYSAERQPIAKGLIDFDKKWSTMMASAPGAHQADGQVIDPKVLESFYVKTRPFTTGVATQYPPQTYLTIPATDDNLATGYPVGKRFHSAPVIRLADARRMQLGHVHKANGAFRLYAFADESKERFLELMSFLDSSEKSPVNRFTPVGDDLDSFIEVLGIYQQDHHDLNVKDQPPALQPLRGRYKLRDTFKVFTPDHKIGPDIFEIRGIDRVRGAMVLVRPDQYVATVLPLTAREQLSDYFESFLYPMA